jgi:hypothetical protein
MPPKIELTEDGQKVERIAFGIVPVGTTKEVKIAVQNVGDIKAEELEFTPEHPDVQVISAPIELDVNEKGLLILKYKPDSQIDRGVSSSLKIDAKYVV